MKIEIVYSPKTGYSIYFIDKHGARYFQGTVSTQQKANEAFADFESKFNK